MTSNKIKKLMKLNSGAGKNFLIISIILAISLGIYISPAVSSQGTDTNNGIASQFLTLPLHPRVLAGMGEEGIGAVEGGHFIWQAPLVNGQPPGQTRENLLPGPSAYFTAFIGTNTLTPIADVNVSNAPLSYEGETGAASNSRGVIVAGSNHIYPGLCASKLCAVLAYTSTDGLSWTKTQMSPTWKGVTFGITFDPAIDVDKNGNFYYVFGGAPLGGSNPNSIAVAKSGSDGTSWGTPVAVTFNKGGAFDDKYYIAVDRSNSSFSNRIYVSWDRNKANNQILYIAYSKDGGASWSAPIKVNDGTSPFERVIGAYPAVDQKTGVVYDSWHDYAKDKIFVDRSTNGGASWGTDVVAATTHTGFGIDIGCVGGRSQSPAHHLKVGSSGKLYLVYADKVADRGFDILLTTSTNGGASWSSPVTLNSDTGSADQFHPTLSVEPNGAGGDKVTVTFYDRRDDSTNCKSYVYATQSIDNGSTWSANVKVTAFQSDFTGNANGPGDYSSSTPSSLGVFPFFSDHRNPDFEIFTARIQ